MKYAIKENTGRLGMIPQYKTVQQENAAEIVIKRKEFLPPFYPGTFPMRSAHVTYLRIRFTMVAVFWAAV